MHGIPAIAPDFAGVEVNTPFGIFRPPLSESETRDMSKKQLLFLSLVAAIPATGLLVLMLFSLRHLLSDQSSASAVLWVIYVVCLLGSAFFASLPLWLWLYYPAAGFEGVAASAGRGQDSRPEFGGKSPAFNGDDDAAEDEEFADDEDTAEDDGEKLFDDDAMDEDLDEFDGGFDDDDDDK